MKGGIKPDMKVFRKEYNVGEIMMAQGQLQEFKDDPTKSLGAITLTFKGKWILIIEYKDIGADFKKGEPRRRE